MRLQPPCVPAARELATAAVPIVEDLSEPARNLSSSSADPDVSGSSHRSDGCIACKPPHRIGRNRCCVVQLGNTLLRHEHRELCFCAFACSQHQESFGSPDRIRIQHAKFGIRRVLINDLVNC